MGRCEECKGRNSREVPAGCVACVVVLEASSAKWARKYHDLVQDAGIESSALDELRQKAEKRCEEAEARLAVVMGALEDAPWSDRLWCNVCASYAEECGCSPSVGEEAKHKALAQITPAAKRLRAIRDAAEAETEAENERTRAGGERDSIRDKLTRALNTAREARRKAVRGEVT